MNIAEKISKYERLNEITDELNSLFQDSFVEEIKSTTYTDADSPSNLIYKAMELIDHKASELEEEILIEEGVDSIYDIKI
jgi:CO dehydrogenase/acetyl-CoA synthase beta subunit